jgi:phosphate-selective porin OprO/OprP
VGAVGIVALLALAPTPAHAQEEFPDSLWNYFQTPWLNVVFGLAIVMDVTSYNQDQASKDYFGNLNEGREGEIRGLRGLFAGQVRVLGKSYDYLFAAAYRGFDRGFEQQTDDEFAVFDLAVTVPVGTDLRVNVGKQKEPFSHDRVQSMLYNPSHERPAYIDGVTRSRNDGILLERWNAQARWKWAVGYYNDWLSPGGLSFLKNPYSLIGRVTGLPIDREADGGPLLHIGGSLNKTWVPETRTSSITAKPEAFFAPNFIDTGPIDIDGAVNLGLEAAFVHGAWNLSGEIIRTDMRQPNGSSPDLWGWHMQAGWTITGERRSYDRRWGVVSLLDPESPTGIGGVGALAAVRPLLVHGRERRGCGRRNHAQVLGKPAVVPEPLHLRDRARRLRRPRPRRDPERHLDRPPPVGDRDELTAQASGHAVLRHQVIATFDRGFDRIGSSVRLEPS